MRRSATVLSTAAQRGGRLRRGAQRVVGPSTFAGLRRHFSAVPPAAEAERPDAPPSEVVVAQSTLPSADVGSPRSSVPANAHFADRTDFPEPTLKDLDLSIPQVDLQWMSELIKARYEYKTGLWEDIQRNRKEFNLGEEKAKQLPSVKFLKLPKLTMSEDQFAAEAAKHEEGVKEYKKRSVSKALIEGLEYDDGVLLIDCRTVGEVGVWGVIEGAKVVPMHDLFAALKMHPATFEAEFGFPKPRQYDKIVFYCQYGARSLMAAQFASYMGWKNVWHFREGYYNWSKQFNRVIRLWFEHDAVSGNDLHRQAQFIIGREISRDIAPELNTMVDKEIQFLTVDRTRSRGAIQISAVASRELDASPTPPELLLTDEEAKALPDPTASSPPLLVDDNSVYPRRSHESYYGVVSASQRGPFSD